MRLSMTLKTAMIYHGHLTDPQPWFSDREIEDARRWLLRRVSRLTRRELLLLQARLELWFGVSLTALLAAATR